MKRQALSAPRSLAILAFRRRELERWIEEAIALLDVIDEDPDLEDDEIESIDEREPPLGIIRGGAGA